jgi:hypothetical protein
MVAGDLYDEEEHNEEEDSDFPYMDDNGSRDDIFLKIIKYSLLEILRQNQIPVNFKFKLSVEWNVGRTRMHTEADGSQTTDRPPN